ncbi:MAG: sigma-70 family RNA polymerase sigma factor [bacterium]|nr:sigma-70 family RNA polymerase sigma factor [bacterium]
MSDRAPSRFVTTHWSLVVAAADEQSEPARSALAELCETYWYPLYAFARRTGANPDVARDLTQGFFVELLAKSYLAQADRTRGRFRTFLLAAFRHFCSKERDKANALKRGSGQLPLSLDYDVGEKAYVAEPRDPMTPEDLYERRWALTLLGRVMEGTRVEYEQAGKGVLFELLEPTLSGHGVSSSYRAIGERVGMSEAAVKVAAHRLRRRFQGRLRATVAATVADPSDVDGELRDLIAAVGK